MQFDCKRSSGFVRLYRNVRLGVGLSLNRPAFSLGALGLVTAARDVGWRTRGATSPLVTSEPMAGDPNSWTAVPYPRPPAPGATPTAAAAACLTVTRSRVRSAIVSNRFVNWTIPQVIPMRMLDKLVAQFFGIKMRRQG